MESKTKEMIFSLVLMVFGVYVAIEGYMIFLRAASAPYFITEFTVSPGFVPVILGVALVFFSILHFISCIKEEGKKSGEVIKEHFAEAAAWVKANKRNVDIAFTVGAVIIMGIYTYVLMELLPFWAATLIFLLAIFFYLRTDKWWKNILVAVLGVIAIVLVFQYCFNAALP